MQNLKSAICNLKSPEGPGRDRRAEVVCGAGPPGCGGRVGEPLSFRRLWDSMLRGGYPELAAHPDRDIALWHAGYVQTFLERDVRMLRQVGDLVQFQSFLRALASRSAQLLNLADLTRDLGGRSIQ